MRDAHRFDRGCDGPGVDNTHIFADTAEGDMRAERLSVECDLATCQLGTYPLPQSEHGRSAGTDPEPSDTWLTTVWKSSGVVDLDIERGDAARRRLHRAGHVSHPLVASRAEEGEGDMQQLRLHATQRGKIRRAAEHCLSDLGRERERDEEPYTRRLEPRGSQPCGLYFVRH